MIDVKERFRGETTILLRGHLGQWLIFLLDDEYDQPNRCTSELCNAGAGQWTFTEASIQIQVQGYQLCWNFREKYSSKYARYVQNETFVLPRTTPSVEWDGS